MLGFSYVHHLKDQIPLSDTDSEIARPTLKLPIISNDMNSPCSKCSKTPGSFPLSLSSNSRVQDFCRADCLAAVWQCHQSVATLSPDATSDCRALSALAGPCAYHVPQVVLPAPKCIPIHPFLSTAF